ncbi:MAG: hypothetical protein DME42_09160 [Verrucomicrobia bacterium]|nr:MAG: hypothetical protein DME42_09160 [Verrucomicrobiota bacterium]
MNLSDFICLEAALRAAAIAQFAVAILNLFLVRIMKWKPDLDRAPLLIREVFHIHVIFISITLSIFAVLTWRFVHEIASAANPLAIWLATAIGTFWIARSVMQWLHYSSRILEKRMSAVFGSAERRPTEHLANDELVGRDSVEPAAVLSASEAARTRLLSRRGEPLFYASWDNVLFIHYETEPDELQCCIPYPLDLYDGRAFVSLVAFTMRGMRPRFGGSLGALLFKPIATHHFLNVRTYVRHRGEAAIYFMREWLSNRMAALLGPRSFGLPYQFGKIEYRNDFEQAWSGRVETSGGAFSYCARLTTNEFGNSAAGSLDEFLQHVAAKVEIVTDDLIRATESWWRDAGYVGANYSPGVKVWMGWPHQIEPGRTG